MRVIQTRPVVSIRPGRGWLCGVRPTYDTGVVQGIAARSDLCWGENVSLALAAAWGYDITRVPRERR